MLCKIFQMLQFSLAFFDMISPEIFEILEALRSDFRLLLVRNYNKYNALNCKYCSSLRPLQQNSLFPIALTLKIHVGSSLSIIHYRYFH